MAAAIWSLPARDVARYPAKAFTRFCENHGLLKISGRPIWRTVAGGSREYVKKLIAPVQERLLLDAPVQRVRREADSVLVEWRGGAQRFDHVVIATHADQALSMLADATDDEQRLLSCFRYSRNETLLHGDATLMPKLRAIWSSWNYLAAGPESGLSVTYWMNRLQNISQATPLFVTLNPPRRRVTTASIGASSTSIRSSIFRHRSAEKAVVAAGPAPHLVLRSLFRQRLSRGWPSGRPRRRRATRGVRRPWSVENQSGRIHVGPAPQF